jgi:hypothetical protein
MVSEEGCKQIEEEKVLLTATSPSAEPAGFFAPDAPLALTRYYPWNLHPADRSLSSQLDCLLDRLVQS